MSMSLRFPTSLRKHNEFQYSPGYRDIVSSREKSNYSIYINESFYFSKQNYDMRCWMLTKTPITDVRLPTAIGLGVEALVMYELPNFLCSD